MNLTRRALKRIPGRLNELPIAGVLFLIGIGLGVLYYSTFTVSGGKPSFYQHQFDAAVMLACGRGFVKPKIILETDIGEGFIDPTAIIRVPSLNNFLNLQSNSFSCDELPANLPVTELTAFQGATRYLMSGVAFIWALFGISWQGLTPLFGVLCGTTVALLYGIFRLGLSRLLAFVGALVIAISPLHLTYLPHLRDYAKAPFILALILVLGWLVTWPLKQATLFTLSIVYGLILGIGLGFRTDLMINILPFIIVLLFFLPGSILANLKLKVGALIIFFATFLITAWPILAVYSSGNNIWHVIILGMMYPFDYRLGLSSPLYEWGYFYSDSFVRIITQSYAYRILDHPGPLDLATKAYEQATSRYFFEIAKIFPADLLGRGYAAVLKILQLPFNVSPTTPPQISNEAIVNFYQGWAATLRPLARYSLFFAAGTLLMVSAFSLRKAIFLFLFLLYFAGFPALQFHPRHFFYLEFISLWALGFLIQQAVQLGQRLLNADQRNELKARLVHPRFWWSPPTKRFLGFSMVMAAFVFIPFLALRQYQHVHLGHVLQTYLNADREELDLQRSPLAEGQVLISSSNLGASSTNRRPWVDAEYLVAEFEAKRCERLTVEATILYKSQVDSPSINKSMDFSQPIKINLSYPEDTTAKIFFPAYYIRDISHFEGLAMSPTQADCLIGLYRVKDSSQFPLLLTLKLSANWQQVARYQTLTEWERQGVGRGLNVQTAPADLAVISILDQPLTPPASAEIILQADIVQLDPKALRIKGKAASPTAYLLQIPNRHLKKGTFFVARGELYEGGFTLGLVKDASWVNPVNVTEPGQFAVILEIPEDGTYTLVLANYLKPPGAAGSSLYNSFVITKAGWVENFTQAERDALPQ